MHLPGPGRSGRLFHGVYLPPMPGSYPVHAVALAVTRHNYVGYQQYCRCSFRSRAATAAQTQLKKETENEAARQRQGSVT